MRQLAIIILTLLTVTSFGQDNDSVKEGIFVTEPMPSYPGGPDSLWTFIKKNTKYPKGTLDYTGTVYVGFVVTEDGSLTNFKVMKGLCDICDENAIETLRKMPNWIPALIDNKPIRARIVLPVKYAQ